MKKLLERLNIFKRLRDLEAQETLLYANVNELLDGVEAILESTDRRAEELRLLNERVESMQRGTIDITLKEGVTIA
jgi:uncharacterized coiled-coil protein SlyX